MDENSIRWRIKMYCKTRGVTLNQLETDCGLGKGYVSKLDKSSPNIGKLEKIANYLNVDLNSLVYGKEKTKDRVYYIDEESARVAQAIFENKELHALFDAARDVRPEDLKMATDMLRRFKETNPDG